MCSFTYSVPFNGPSNEDVVARLIKEVKANNPQFQVCHIRGMFLTTEGVGYFPQLLVA